MRVATVTSEQTNTDALCVFNTTRTFEGTGTFWFGGSSGTATDRILGLLSHTVGELDRAAAHFEDSLVFFRPGDIAKYTSGASQ